MGKESGKFTPEMSIKTRFFSHNINNNEANHASKSVWKVQACLSAHISHQTFVVLASLPALHGEKSLLSKLLIDVSRPLSCAQKSSRHCFVDFPSDVENKKLEKTRQTASEAVRVIFNQFKDIEFRFSFSLQIFPFSDSYST
jgi:hypothetical protein